MSGRPARRLANILGALSALLAVLVVRPANSYQGFMFKSTATAQTPMLTILGLFTAALGAFGQEALKAAQSKKPDVFLDMSDKLTSTCGNCHDMYRENKPGGIAGRCVK